MRGTTIKLGLRSRLVIGGRYPRLNKHTSYFHLHLFPPPPWSAGQPQANIYLGRRAGRLASIIVSHYSSSRARHCGMTRSTGPEGLEPMPLVIVQGFLGNTGRWLWGDFERHLNRDLKSTPRRTIFVSVGPVSSLHDRACELYYSLLGGTVDYGEEHSTTHKHARYGRNIGLGQYPEWSPSRPLHFLGHSIGGPTIIKLQSLIKQGHFGPSAHPKMIVSVNAVSAPFRGTQAVYILGERPDAAPAVNPLSVGALVGKGVHILSFLSPLLPRVFDLHGDCRSLTYRDISVLSLLKQLWKSDWAESRDATPFDVTFQAADERELMGEGDVEPETFYQSHVARMTQRSRSDQFGAHTPSLRHIMSPFLYILSRLLCTFDYSNLQPPPSFLTQRAPARSVPDGDSIMGDEYWANDGVVPIFSQWHPLPCGRTRCRHFGPVAPELVEYTDNDYHRDRVTPRPGIWCVNWQEEDANHMSLLPLWTGTSRQRRFWEQLGRWLLAVDKAFVH
ncbi:alpha/beta-hydrolase [Mycena belliarum]|uniref:Alpha/beta-hydrolase n=1 Tax=Mycena belliarum TaxID=1033014 RepID=A0AAD6UP71_9AGAR|nr:alpha/beta-hydrolase [Mycena belliae]